MAGLGFRRWIIRVLLSLFLVGHYCYARVIWNDPGGAVLEIFAHNPDNWTDTVSPLQQMKTYNQDTAQIDIYIRWALGVIVNGHLELTMHFKWSFLYQRAYDFRHDVDCTAGDKFTSDCLGFIPYKISYTKAFFHRMHAAEGGRLEDFKWGFPKELYWSLRYFDMYNVMRYRRYLFPGGHFDVVDDCKVGTAGYTACGDKCKQKFLDGFTCGDCPKGFKGRLCDVNATESFDDRNIRTYYDADNLIVTYTQAGTEEVFIEKQELEVFHQQPGVPKMLNGTVALECRCWRLRACDCISEQSLNTEFYIPAELRSLRYQARIGFTKQTTDETITSYTHIISFHKDEISMVDDTIAVTFVGTEIKLQYDIWQGTNRVPPTNHSISLEGASLSRHTVQSDVQLNDLPRIEHVFDLAQTDNYTSIRESGSILYNITLQDALNRTVFEHGPLVFRPANILVDIGEIVTQRSGIVNTTVMIQYTFREHSGYGAPTFHKLTITDGRWAGDALTTDFVRLDCYKTCTGTVRVEFGLDERYWPVFDLTGFVRFYDQLQIEKQSSGNLKFNIEAVGGEIETTTAKMVTTKADLTQGVPSQTPGMEASPSQRTISLSTSQPTVVDTTGPRDGTSSGKPDSRTTEGPASSTLAIPVFIILMAGILIAACIARYLKKRNANQLGVYKEQLRQKHGQRRQSKNMSRSNRRQNEEALLQMGNGAMQQMGNKAMHQMGNAAMQQKRNAAVQQKGNAASTLETSTYTTDASRSKSSKRTRP